VPAKHVLSSHKVQPEPLNRIGTGHQDAMWETLPGQL
jgi:hypothetical protein